VGKLPEFQPARILIFLKKDQREVPSEIHNKVRASKNLSANKKERPERVSEGIACKNDHQ